MRRCDKCGTQGGIMERRILEDGRVVCTKCFEKMQTKINSFSCENKLNNTS